MSDELRDKVKWFCYFLTKDLEVKKEYLTEFSEVSVRTVCMNEALERIERFCKKEGIDIESAREFAEGSLLRTSKSNEQTDDFDGNPLTVV